MDKQSFLAYFSGELNTQASLLYEKLHLSKRNNCPVFTSEFYIPEIWTKLLEMSKNLNVQISSYGISEISERRMLVFNPQEYVELPLVIIKVICSSNYKVNTHGDYLGALMSLGIKREKFSDLILTDDGLVFATFKDIANYIISNLNHIGSSPCTLEVLNYVEENYPKVCFEEFKILCSSTRLDSIVACLLHSSRENAVDSINSGRILLNYLTIKDKSAAVSLGSTLTIRGKGKYIIGEVAGTSSKGKTWINIKKYI